MTATAAELPLLSARQLSAAYSQRPVLHDVDFSLSAGEFVGLAGPNGSGKTTLLHCLTGYHSADRGNVTIGGASAERLSRAEIARQVAFVPQFTESIYGFGVREMVLMGRYPYGGLRMVNGPEDLALADGALETIQVQHLRDRLFNELSGGEKQLVLLARAIVQNAPVLIMDEPLTGLDLRHQFQVMEALHSLSRKPGGAALATFHDLAAAARWCDRIVLLKDGRIMADGAPREILTAQLLAEVYGVSAAVSFSEDGTLHLGITGAL
jgi:iron complex transport system ATP-binding protein